MPDRVYVKLLTKDGHRPFNAFLYEVTMTADRSIYNEAKRINLSYTAVAIVGLVCTSVFPFAIERHGSQAAQLLVLDILLFIILIIAFFAALVGFLFSKPQYEKRLLSLKNNPNFVFFALPEVFAKNLLPMFNKASYSKKVSVFTAAEKVMHASVALREASALKDSFYAANRADCVVSSPAKEQFAAITAVFEKSSDLFWNLYAEIMSTDAASLKSSTASNNSAKDTSVPLVDVSSLQQQLKELSAAATLE